MTFASNNPHESTTSGRTKTLNHSPYTHRRTFAEHIRKCLHLIWFIVSGKKEGKSKSIYAQVVGMSCKRWACEGCFNFLPVSMLDIIKTLLLCCCLSWWTSSFDEESTHFRHSVRLFQSNQSLSGRGFTTSWFLRCPPPLLAIQFEQRICVEKEEEKNFWI